MRARFPELVAEAGVRDAERVAGIIHLLYEGGLVTAHVGGDQHALATAKAATNRLLSHETTAQ